MSYKICVKQLLQDQHNYNKKDKAHFAKKRQIKECKTVNLNEGMQKCMSRIVRKKEAKEEVKEKSQNLSLQNCYAKRNILKSSTKRKSQVKISQQDSPVKKLFKELFYQKQSPMSKGSYLISNYLTTPRLSAIKKDMLNNVNINNVSLDRTYYYRKVLNPQKTESVSQDFFEPDKNTSRTDENIPQTIGSLKSTNQSDKILNSYSTERNQMWGSTMNKLRSKLIDRTKDTYKGCHLKIHQINTEDKKTSRALKRVINNRSSKALKSNERKNHDHKLKKPQNLEITINQEHLNPWSTTEFRLTDFHQSSFH